jgi:hypothetical protein
MKIKLKMSLAFKNRPLGTGGKAADGEPSSPSVPKTTKAGTLLGSRETKRGLSVPPVADYE